MSQAVSSSAPASQPSTPSSSPGSQPQGQAQPGGQAQGQPQVEAKPQAPLTEADYEEIALGSAKGKVPKELAKAIKEFEKGFRTKLEQETNKNKQSEAQFRQWAQQAKANPDVFFQQFGIDPDQYSQARLAKYLELQSMSPEARRAMDLEAENKHLKETEKQRVERESQEKDQRESHEFTQRARTEMFEAWKDSGMPPTPFLGARIAATMAAAGEQKLNWTWKEAAAKVKQDWIADVRQVLGGLDPDKLQEILSDAPLKKWRDWDVKQLGQAAKQSLPGQSSSQASPGGHSSASQRKPDAKPALTEQQWKSWRSSGMPFEAWKAKHLKG